MDYYDWQIEDGMLAVDFRERHQGDQGVGRATSRVQVAEYDVLDPDWPTSGWSSLVVE